MKEFPLRSLLFGAACVGSVTSAVYAALVVLAATRFNKRRKAAERNPLDFAPPLSVLKPLHGMEPGLAENLQSFFTQQYAGHYELLFCARSEDDPGLTLARSIGTEHPEVPSRYIACGEPLFPNPKVYSLAIMADSAQHTLLVTSDADSRVTPDCLARLAQEMRDPGNELAFSLYLAVPDRPGFSLYLDALGKSVEMNSGVLVADMLTGTDFSLGVTVIQRREVFERAGGFAELGSYWAEDFVLGRRLVEQGRGVHISTYVIQLIVSATTAAHSFLNQLRWAQSTRRSRPLGHLGSSLTFAMPFALLGCAVEIASHNYRTAALFLVAAATQRILMAGFVLQILGSDLAWRDACAFPIRDLYGFAVWMASYLPAETRYHGTRFRIMPDGRLEQA